MTMTLPVLTDSIQNYLTEINRFPLLAQDEELRIAKRYYKTRSLEDAHTLVTSNLRYVVKVAFEFRNYGCRIADLIQEGNIGLMHAVKKFNPFKGFRIITYATWWIRSAIQEFILRTKGIVRRNSRALKKRLFYKNDSADGKETEAYNATNDVSLDTPVNDGPTTHLDILKDERPGPMLALEESRKDADVRKDVTSALAILNPKERLIIEKRVMADEPESLQGLGTELGLTRERVRQIESAAIKKLRACLAPVPDNGRTCPEPA